MHYEKIKYDLYQEDDLPVNQKACTRTPTFSGHCRHNIQSN
jgi:hypothetical protein